MNVLLVNPKYPDTYWNFEHALKFISKDANNPPLGLITVASMLPAQWVKKMVDLNIDPLQDREIAWADYVFIGAMSVQSASAIEVVDRCKSLNKKVVAGGPLFTGDPESFTKVDHLVLNEAEITLPLFLADLANKRTQKIYRTEEFADMHRSPAPDYSLIDVSRYGQLCIQYTRGCPYNCEFCEITVLFGRKVRTKTTGQIIHELEIIYNTGFRGNLFFVDDNFIGNRKKLKRDLLPAIISWNREHKHPFTFTTEASINLADDPELLKMMAEVGFERVFVGIETVEEKSLEECGKTNNIERDMQESIFQIQAAGIEVSAGFIVGFDHDPPEIFQRQVDFIQQSGIITAMVGLLNAPQRTRLYKRLSSEGRINETYNGNNTGYSINFTPKMNLEKLLSGYRYIIDSIYSNRPYYERLLRFLKYFSPGRSRGRTKITYEKIVALFRSILYIGILSRGRIYYWKLFLWSLFNRPRLFPLAIAYSIYGYHFRKVFGVRN
jgi:radical SAM superfamily enzyme YgiQ (UPF0313 family)